MGAAADRFSALVQESQRKFLDHMQGQWARVLAGEITEAEYWEISEGEIRDVSRAEIQAATEEYERSLKGTRPPLAPARGVMASWRRKRRRRLG